MTDVKTSVGELAGHNARVAVVATRFNEFIVSQLLAGALDGLTRHGVDEARIEVIRVPGAYELPLVARTVAKRGGCEALIALGCIIRGATAHFDYVARECASGLSRVALDFDIPIAFGVLTTDTIEQAIERAGTKAGNKGFDAALSALEMVSLMHKLSG